MTYGKRRRVSTLALPALYGAIAVSIIAQIAFTGDLYIGALYPPDPGILLPSVILAPLVAIPAAFFGFFAVWPPVLISAELAAWMVRRNGGQRDWQIWLLSGAVLGGPALFLYSFPLRLGQAMLGPLLANGAFLGLICAALVRKFAGPQIDDAAIAADPEGADDTV